MKLPILLTSLLFGSALSSTDVMFDANKFQTEAKKRGVEGNKKILPVGTVYVIIDKSDYELNVYDERGWYATYPVVFGSNTLGDKKMEGDRCTPEGSFHIISKKIHNKWDRFIALYYPTKDSYEKFNERKSRGEIPNNARIGGG